MLHKVHNIDPEWDEIKKDEQEKCINCGCETPYTRNTHIDYRNHYIEGAGQLCKKCYDGIDPKIDDFKLQNYESQD